MSDLDPNAQMLAWSIKEDGGWLDDSGVESISWDLYDLIRKSERTSIVDFLNCCGGEFACKYADWIEAGEHLK